MAKKKPAGSSKSPSKAPPARTKAKDAAPKKPKPESQPKAETKPAKPPAKKPAARPDPKAKPAAPAKPAPKRVAAPEPAPAKPAAKPSKPAPKVKAEAPAKPSAKAAAEAPPKPSRGKEPASKAEAAKPAKDGEKHKPASPAAPSKKGKADKPEKPAPAPQPRFRSMFSDDGAQGAAAAAKLLDAMGIARPTIGDAAAPLNTDGEKRLTKSPLKKTQLKEFQDVLLRKRQEIVGDVNAMESQALSASDRSSSALSQHMADQGSDTYDQTLALDLAASQRDLLREIDAALDRIDNNTFGICEATGRAIRLERLENTPWARLSIDAARAAESMGFRR